MLDPMHDLQFNHLSGWPDADCAPSVVRCYKQTVTIAKPASLTGSGWDCSMVLFPWLREHSFVHSNQIGSLLTNQQVYPVPRFGIGGLSCACKDTGVNSDFTDYQATITLDQPDDGRSRVVGMGFEVTNTSAELYRSGSVTVWRLPGVEQFGDSTYRIKHVNPPLNTEDTLYGSLQLYAPVPNSQSHAQMIPGSRTWNAEKGCYVVATPLSSDNPAKLPEYKGILMRPNSAIQEVWSSPDSGGSWTTWSQGSVYHTLPLENLEETHNWFAMPGVRVEPFNVSGAYFTGLHDNSVLTIQLNVYWETFPNNFDNLLTLATPSLGENEKLLQLVSELVNQLPVGVPADENPDGEWFARVVSKIGPLAKAAALASGQAWAMPLIEAAQMTAEGYLAPPSNRIKPVKKKVVKPQPKKIQQKKKKPNTR